MSILYDLPLLGPLIEMLLTVVLPFLVVLSIVVFVHEMGHYLVGRWCGIKAEAFSIGFGREIFGWTDRHNTRWRVSLLPLGGYVKFRGDTDAASSGATAEVAQMSPEERRTTLNGAPIWARALTILAGPMANFILTIILAFFLTFATGVANRDAVIGKVAPESLAAKAGLRPGDQVLRVDGKEIDGFRGFAKALEYPGSETKLLVRRDGAEVELTADLRVPAEVARVAAGKPADLACIRKGDVIVGYGDKPIRSFGELRKAVEASGGAETVIKFVRNGETKSAKLTPHVAERINPDTKQPERVYQIGVVSKGGLGVAPQMLPASVGQAAVTGVAMPYLVAEQTFGYIYAWITQKVDGSSINSLIGIADASGRAASLGIVAFLQLIALISAAIGIMNLLPIPVLDGGHLVFHAVEAVRGRPVNERWMEIAMTVGLAAVLLLMVFATMNDLSPLLAKLSAKAC
ncbi:MAG: RIP metalloprotease RseP [Neomegalonema sp.]|nr:RIP metalloprotease RseP [Neomegalonema sp.]